MSYPSARDRSLDLLPFTKKSGEAVARERHRAFLQRSSLGDRPALWITARSPVIGADWLGEAEPLDKESDLDSEWHWRAINRELSTTEYLADSLPVATIMVGTDVTNTAVLLGGDYEYFGTEAIVRRQPELLDSIPERFDSSAPLVVSLEQVYRYVLRRVDDRVSRRAFVNTVMTADALTTMSLLYGQLELCRKVLSDPQWVAETTLEISRLAMDFYEHFYDLLVASGHGESSGWFNSVCEGRFDCLRCDFAVMISPDSFGRVAMPQLEYVASRLDACLFNMDDTGMMRFIDQLASIGGLTGIYWNPAPKKASLYDHIDSLRTIKDRGLSLHVQASDTDEAAFVARELGPDGLLIALPRFDSAACAEEAVETITRATKRLKRGAL